MILNFIFCLLVSPIFVPRILVDFSSPLHNIKKIVVLASSCDTIIMCAFQYAGIIHHRAMQNIRSLSEQHLHKCMERAVPTKGLHYGVSDDTSSPDVVDSGR